MQSEKAILPENRNIDCKFNFKYGPITKVIIEKNKLKNNGINNKDTGIKNLKLSSKVNE